MRGRQVPNGSISKHLLGISCLILSVTKQRKSNENELFRELIFTTQDYERLKQDCPVPISDKQSGVFSISSLEQSLDVLKLD